MEDDLNIWKVEYINNHWLDQMYQTEDDIQWKKTWKYEKLNISATTGRILLKFET